MEVNGKKLGDIWPLSEFVKAKARKYFEAGKVEELSPGVWSVAGSGERPYIVQTDARIGSRWMGQISCTCDHGKHTSGRSRCSHAVAVAMTIVAARIAEDQNRRQG